jgi:2,3-bisphosphoglycerate-dependent phosphoglycerate mutase
MKNTFQKILFLILLMGSFLCIAQSDTVPNSNATAIYFIRHAEKDRSNLSEKNPHLNTEGKKRSEKWVHFFKDIPLAAVYSTQYQRTEETALPTATDKGLVVQFYDANKLDPTPFLEKHQGTAILIVGHSNTTPAFVNEFIKEKRFKDLSDNDNGSVFKVQYINGQILVQQYHVD